MATLTIRDESAAGETLLATRVELPEEQVTVEELLRSYVFQRVKDSNLQRTAEPSPAPRVVPNQDEMTLNGSKPPHSSTLDWQSEFDKAKQAFRHHQILVFVNDEQMNSLDATVGIRPSTDIKFLRLAMLMGG